MEVSGQLATPLLPGLQKNFTRCPLDWRLGGPWSLSGRCGGEKNLALLRIKAGPSRVLSIAIPTELSRFQKFNTANIQARHFT
jgi:hypothetical protein